MSGENQGPDLFFAGGECLTRFGVWVRRTDVDLEEATQEVFTRNSDGQAIGRDGLLRIWETDTPRAEWLNQADIEALRNLIPNTNIKTWDLVSNCVIEQLSDLLFEVTDPGAALSFCRPDTFAVPDGSTLRCSIDIRKDPDARTVNFRIAGTGNSGIFLDPRQGNFSFLGDASDVTVTLTLDNYWRCEFTTTPADGSGLQVQLYPAFSNQGELTGVSDPLATGETDVRAPQVEFGTERTAFQETPLDDDRKFPALLLEAASTNLLLESNDLINNTPWLRVRSQVSLNVATDPTGAVGADKLFDDLVDNTHYIQQEVSKTAAALTYQFSFFLKPDEYSRTRVFANDGSGANGVFIDFDLATGEAFSEFDSFGVGWVPTDFGSRRLPDGWFRYFIHFTTDAISTAIQVQIRLDNGTGSGYLGDGSSGILFGGAQLEQAFPVSSHIFTGGVTATRAADNFRNSFRAPPIAMSFYFKFIEGGSAQMAANTRIFNIGGTGQGNSPRLHVSTSGSLYRLLHENDALEVALETLAVTPFVGDLVELNGVLFDDGSIQLAQTINGGEETQTGRSLPVPLASKWFSTVNNFYLNSVGSSVTGLNNFLAVKFNRGVRSLGFMRAL